MEGIESWGTGLILWLQTLGSPTMDVFFRLITLLGDEKFYLVLLPLVYWCIDKRLGMRLAILVMTSNTLNVWCKHAWGLPRPSTPVRVLTLAEGFGFPSGHTQVAAVAFAYLAYQVRRWGAYVATAVLILLVGLSRMYLGVHFPHDVLGGLAFGLVFVAVFAWVTPKAEARWATLPRARRYALALVMPVLFLAIWPLVDTAGSLGGLAGFATGGVIESERVRFSAVGALWQRVVRFLLGFAVVAVLYFGLKEVLPEGVPWRFLRYGLIGFFGTGLALGCSSAWAWPQQRRHLRLPQS